MNVHYLQHAPFEGPGHIAGWARARGHRPDGTELFAGDVPPPLQLVDLLVVLGGPMSVHDDEYWLPLEKRYIADAIAAGKRVLGVCLGAQLLADVLGADVHPGAHREVGWFDVELTEDGDRSTLLAGLPRRFETVHWHGDTFDLPDGAAWLAYSEATRNQAFEYGGRVLALQFHLEATPESWRALADACGDELAAGGPYVQDAADMLARPERFVPGNELLERVLDALVTLA